MRFTSLAACEQYLASNTSLQLASYAILAKEDSDRGHLVSSLRKYLPQDLQRFVAGQTPFSTILEELSSLSWLSSAKTILLENVDLLPKQDLQALLPYIPSPTKGCYLLMTAASLPSASKLYTTLDQHGLLIDLSSEKPWEREDRFRTMAVSFLQQAQKKIAQPALQLLVKHAGGDLWSLENECHKLIAYLGLRQEVTLRDVHALTMNLSHETGWKLGDALLEGDFPAAFRIAKSLLQDGIAPHAILAQLRGQMEKGLVAASLLEGGGTSLEVAKRLAPLSGKALERQIAIARSFGTMRFKKALEALYEGDLLARSSAEPSWALEHMIAKFSKKTWSIEGL